MYDSNVLYSILLTSVLYSIYVLSTDVSTAQYVITVYWVSTAQYLRSLLSTDVSTVQYLDNKYWVSFTMSKMRMRCTAHGNQGERGFAVQ